jgi:Domain of unknown function (DUF6484)
MMNRDTDQTCSDQEGKSSEPSVNASARFALSLGSVYTGTLVGLTTSGEPLVEFAANPSLTAVQARSCVELGWSDIGGGVVLAFEEGDVTKPLLMGCLKGRTSGIPAGIGSSVEARDSARVTCLSGDDLQVSAADSLTLRCGKASVTLTREGRVLINGVYVETRASGTNRLQGGAVRIN